MKTFRQHGLTLKEESIDTGNVCECCRDFSHAAQEFLSVDVECPSCGALCCCDCHQRASIQPTGLEED